MTHPGPEGAAKVVSLLSSYTHVQVPSPLCFYFNMPMRIYYNSFHNMYMRMI